MTDSQQLPLFDLPASDGDARPKPRKTRAPHTHADEPAETLPLITDDLPPLHIEPAPPPIAAAPAPEPEPEPAPEVINMKYPLPSKIVPTILHAESRAVLEWLAPRAIEAGDAPLAAEMLVEVLGDMDDTYSIHQRANAALMLRWLHEPINVEPLVARLWNDSGHVSRALAETLGEMGTWPETEFDQIERIVTGLIVALRHADPATRIAAAQSLGKMGAVAAVPEMINRLQLETEPEVLDVIVMVLSDLGTVETIEGILNAYDDQRISYELACKGVLNAGASAIDPLLNVIATWDQSESSRALAADVLAQWGVVQAVDPLTAITQRADEPEMVRSAAERALQSLTRA